MRKDRNQRIRWKARRQVAAVAGLVALFLQLCAVLAPASAMSSAGAGPAETWGLRLCISGDETGTKPAKQKTDHLHDQCQICQTLHSLNWASTPRPININLPSQVGTAHWRFQDQRVAALSLAAGFSSRAPPLFA